MSVSATKAGKRAISAVKLKANARITKDISPEVKRVGKLLDEISSKPADLQNFLKRPTNYLSKAGIDLSKYASKKVPVKAIEADIAIMVASIFERGLVAQLQGIGEVANTYSSSSDTSYEYNFDHSTSSDYKYESHTGTSRGTFSETSSGTATDTKTSFSGLTTRAYLELIAGPLISNVAMKEILSQVELTLLQAVKQQSAQM
jgi:hypothetical protein